MLLNVLDFEVEAGLTANAEALLVQELPTARSIAERADWLLDRIGARRDGAPGGRSGHLPRSAGGHGCDTQHLDTNQRAVRMLGRRLFGPSPARLIAESAPQAARIAQSIRTAQSIEGELRRSYALVLIASALPN
jgi:hypothetical protein